MLLRNKWRNVWFLFIDEISLVSAQLLCEIDHALRFAKERPNEWFGDIHVIFAGDFFQFPPVGGTPLYVPIAPYGSQSTTEIMKRLGRLAWKSVTDVISFMEQQRMKKDVEYAAAVTRLRVRECTLADVDLFNSQVIK
jgi:PIF1-like helicase